MVIKNYIERRINAFEADIQEYRQSMQRDYERFMTWDAEDFYKVSKKLDFYKQMQVGEEQGTLEEMLKHSIEHMKDDILFGQMQRRSTNSMANMLHVFDIEVKQELIQRCQQLLNEINENKA